MTTPCIYTNGLWCVAEGIPCNGADVDAECFTEEAAVDLPEGAVRTDGSGHVMSVAAVLEVLEGGRE